MSGWIWLTLTAILMCIVFNNNAVNFRDIDNIFQLRSIKGIEGTLTRLY